MKKIVHFYDVKPYGNYSKQAFINSCLERFFSYKKQLKAVQEGKAKRRSLYKFFNFFLETADSNELRKDMPNLDFTFHKLSEKAEKYKWEVKTDVKI